MNKSECAPAECTGCCFVVQMFCGISVHIILRYELACKKTALQMFDQLVISG